ARRRWSDAVAAWSEVPDDRPDPDGSQPSMPELRKALAQSIDVARLNESIDHFNAGDLIGALQANLSGQMPEDLSGKAARLCKLALARLLTKASQGTLDAA